MWIEGVRAVLDVLSPKSALMPDPAHRRTKEAPGDPEAYAVLFSEAIRAIEGQRGSVDELRSRAGLLLSAAALIAAFLGPDAIAAKAHTNYGVVAGGMLLLAVVLLLWVLVPVQGWSFDVDFQTTLAKYVETDIPATMAEIHRSLAWYLDLRHMSNDGMLRRRYRALEIAAILVIGETILWLVAISQGA